jgi:hypothetical protein
MSSNQNNRGLETIPFQIVNQSGLDAPLYIWIQGIIPDKEPAEYVYVNDLRGNVADTPKSSTKARDDPATTSLGANLTQLDFFGLPLQLDNYGFKPDLKTPEHLKTGFEGNARSTILRTRTRPRSRVQASTVTVTHRRPNSAPLVPEPKSSWQFES